MRPERPHSQPLRHAEVAPAAGVEIFLLQVVAIGAVEIADRANWLGHDVKRLHGNATHFLNRDGDNCPMKKPTRQRLVGRVCEDSGDADQLSPHDCRFPTRLLDCQ